MPFRFSISEQLQIIIKSTEDKNSEGLHNLLKSELSTLFVDITGILFQNFSPKQYSFDSMADQNLVVIRLDAGESRLSVNRKHVDELKGFGYFIPKGMCYSLLEGKTNRSIITFNGTRTYSKEIYD